MAMMMMATMQQVQKAMVAAAGSSSFWPGGASPCDVVVARHLRLRRCPGGAMEARQKPSRALLQCVLVYAPQRVRVDSL